MPDSENRRLENLFGTLLTALSDSLVVRAEQAAGHSGATAGALTYLVQEPGLGIDQLKDPLGLSQSATVRLVDRLVADGLVERRPGRDGRSISVHLTPSGESVAQRTSSTSDWRCWPRRWPHSGQVERCAMTGLVEKILGEITRMPRTPNGFAGSVTWRPVPSTGARSRWRPSGPPAAGRLRSNPAMPALIGRPLIATDRNCGSGSTTSQIGAPGGIRTHTPFGNGF